MSDKIYCYPDSDVLKNKLGIRDMGQLGRMEKRLTMLRILELVDKPIQGKFDLIHLQAIHKYIFQDVYEWAGRIRKVDIAKGNMFCNVKFIESQAEEIFGKLKEENYLQGLDEKEISIRLAYYFSEINALHPFRDAHVIIGTRLEKPSKINGFALLSPIFLSHAGWREDGAVHINTYYTESQMGLCA